MCAVCGVFVLTLPIPIVVNSFAGFYKNRLLRQVILAKRRQKLRKLRKTNSTRVSGRPTVSGDREEDF